MNARYFIGLFLLLVVILQFTLATPPPCRSDRDNLGRPVLSSDVEEEILDANTLAYRRAFPSSRSSRPSAPPVNRPKPQARNTRPNRPVRQNKSSKVQKQQGKKRSSSSVAKQSTRFASLKKKVVSKFGKLPTGLVRGRKAVFLKNYFTSFMSNKKRAAQFVSSYGNGLKGYNTIPQRSSEGSEEEEIMYRKRMQRRAGRLGGQWSGIGQGGRIIGGGMGIREGPGRRFVGGVGPGGRFSLGKLGLQQTAWNRSFLRSQLRSSFSDYSRYSSFYGLSNSFTVKSTINYNISPKAISIVKSAEKKYDNKTGPTNTKKNTRGGYQVQKKQCVACRVDCLRNVKNYDRPIFSVCKKRYFYYGCQAAAPCYTTKGASITLLDSMVGICITRNGCVLHSDFTFGTNPRENSLMKQSLLGNLTMVDTTWE